MRNVHVDLGERGYGIRIGRTLCESVDLSRVSGARVLLVSDSHVAPLHGDALSALLTGADCRVAQVTVPAGERSKSFDQLLAIYEASVDAGLDRRSCIVALGGGMVGDLAGFAAATYMRGIGFVQVPTTLLAMVDSSVGGKTAVNLPQGKNLVGAFHQPIDVWTALDTLETLPDREYRSGLAEVVKSGVIWDAVLFDTLEQNVDGLLARDPVLLEDVIARCCEIKAEVVAMDERESGVRAILNFGHTLGHALETLSGYGNWLHGEAVAVGMVFAERVSREEKDAPPQDGERLCRLLDALDLPVRLPSNAPGWEDIQAAMLRDKKSQGRRARFVLARKLGSVVFGCEVESDVLRRNYEALQAT